MFTGADLIGKQNFEKKIELKLECGQSREYIQQGFMAILRLFSTDLTMNSQKTQKHIRGKMRIPRKPCSWYESGEEEQLPLWESIHF